MAGRPTTHSPHPAGAHKGRGRIKGGKNKLTLLREEKLEQARERLDSVINDEGLSPFIGDAHAFLVYCYKNPKFDLKERIDAAKAAIRFEKPALASVDNKHSAGGGTIQIVTGVPRAGD
jgi:hypothetical protein